MKAQTPSRAENEPARVGIVGAGTIGRRIASVFVAGGSEVCLFDTSVEQRDQAKRYVAEHLEEFTRKLRPTSPGGGALMLASELEEMLQGCWLAIEAVPERLELKRRVMAELDDFSQPEVILASNSSSFPTRLLIDGVAHPERLLNMHYQLPPDFNSVELMSCGKTDERLIRALMERLPLYGLVPFHVRRESDGFIFNRIWAAIKRECLMVAGEGVAPPEDIDQMWRLFWATDTGPFRLMDQIGLDVVLDVEERFASIRPGLPEGPRRLLRDLIEEGRLGRKSGRGFYEYPGSGEPPGGPR
jgi:3-hydroxybutyryl-CoA dehydrogenase